MNDARLNPKKLWKPFLIAAAILFLYFNVLTKLASDWATDENYSHGLLVPFVIAFIIWSDFETLGKVRKNPSVFFGGAVVLFALLILLAGTLGAELFLQRFSFVLMLAGVVIYFFGARILRFLFVPFALLLLAVPIPQIIFNKIAFPLQIWASQLAVWGIRLFEVASVRKGNVIEILPVGSTQIVALEVVEACSGIRSLMTLVTLALVLAYFTRTREMRAEENWFDLLKSYDFLRGVLLMLSAVPIAILTNAARVTATGVLTYKYGKQAAEGFTHDISGWLVYVTAFVLLLAANFILMKILRERSGARKKIYEGENASITEETNANSAFGARLCGAVFPLVFALVLGGILINWFERRGEVSVQRKPLREIPAKLGDWQQAGGDIRFSEQTESVLRTSDYVMRDYFAPDGRRVNLYVGYYASQRTGATYHSPQNCLPGAGWEMIEPELIEIKTASGKIFTANRYIVRNGDSREVLIYWYEGRGRAVASEYVDKIYTIFDGIVRRRSDGAMIRVMTPLTDDENESLQKAVDISAHLAENLLAFVPQ